MTFHFLLHQTRLDFCVGTAFLCCLFYLFDPRFFFSKKFSLKGKHYFLASSELYFFSSFKDCEDPFVVKSKKNEQNEILKPLVQVRYQMAKLCLNFKKSSRLPIFVRNLRWVNPTRAYFLTITL